MTTIRLSDRLTIEHSAEAGCHARLTNYKESITDDLCEAIVALANPPRYDLPPGVVAGLDGKFYAPGDVVRNLPDEMWTHHFATGEACSLQPSYWAFYEVRPTAANPVPTLPEHTSPLPDGRLACLRRDAAKLREAGAVIRYPNGGIARAESDRLYPDKVLWVEFPPPAPATEDVPWQQSIGRKLPNGKEIIGADATTIRPRTKAGTPAKHTYAFVNPDGTVTVLVDGDQR